ncbi:hemerythrin domain-containing protein [Paraburkholderia phymatum]|uniref:hemerythrin domain-containing protein n=1 Tax=Paraburkholderia phymatum TaxID=148447 RepID=UPI00317578DA
MAVSKRIPVEISREGHSTHGELAWSDEFLLGYPAMDDTHRDFVCCVVALRDASETEFFGRLQDMVTHCEQHFDQEAQWMRTTEFPAAQCHMDEHEAVLRSLRAALQFIAKGGAHSRVASVALALADWFPGHATYMDAALSHWISKRTFGGIPVVLRRQLPSISPGSARSEEGG